MLHTLVCSVIVLGVVMVVTAGRRPVRRLLLGLPIGLFLHLVFDGAWSDTATFWWPAGGWGFEDARLPAAERGWWNVPLEIVGLAMLVWVWSTAGLAARQQRRAFFTQGRLAADAAP